MSPKRKGLSLKDKLSLLHKYDNLLLKTVCQRDAAIKLNISQATLSSILKNRNEIQKNVLLNKNPDRKRKRIGKI